MKPYDAKKSVWVPNKEEGGYDEGLLQSVEGDKATVKVGWEMKTFKEADCVQVNPPKMEKIEDVTYMTYLNDASVLWNLKTRYIAQLIYVSSAICVPCEVLPINIRTTRDNIKMIFFYYRPILGSSASLSTHTSGIQSTPTRLLECTLANVETRFLLIFLPSLMEPISK